ncbi:PIR protein [Plasmodium vivax]|uniref:VIR protein n=1 Tax=Plasmodium vivax TaxID=5855 RepID=A0A564ZWJ0_PLAVI|nr:PIR protein [Plasmodium vivax]
MSTEPQNPEYLSYHNYGEFKNQLERAVTNNDKDAFNNIINTMSNVPNIENFRSSILTKLHNVLRNDPAFYNGKGISYCKYVNFWLNKQLRQPGYENFQKYFNVFQDFAHEYAYQKQKKYVDSCKKYIHNMEDVYIGMNFLYEFYDFFEKLSSPNDWVYKPACEKLSDKTFTYNQAIQYYYDKYPDLYENISHVKGLIEKLLEKKDSNCNKTVNFREPQQVLEEEKRIKQQKEEAERQRTLAEEAETKRQQEQEAERRRLEEIQQELEAQKRNPQIHTDHGAQQEIFHQGTPLLSPEQANSGETVYLGTQERSNVLPDRRGLHYSGRLDDLKAPGLGLHEDQSETRVLKPENEETSTDGSYIGSLGLPSAITEVFRSVEPAPILGVSGGMGALFLLFKYTPVGSFFGGRRGRFRQIPRSFNGPFPGEFPNFQDYDGGFIGYSPMGVSHLAE